MFKIRAALAATLSTSWGIYSGYELCEGTPLPGREEYLDSEKYQLKVRDWNKPGNIKAFITRLNRARLDHPAFQHYANLALNPLCCLRSPMATLRRLDCCRLYFSQAAVKYEKYSSAPSGCTK
jgi:hypothetical protein